MLTFILDECFNKLLNIIQRIPTIKTKKENYMPNPTLLTPQPEAKDDLVNLQKIKAGIAAVNDYVSACRAKQLKNAKERHIVIKTSAPAEQKLSELKELTTVFSQVAIDEAHACWSQLLQEDENHHSAWVNIKFKSLMAWQKSYYESFLKLDGVAKQNNSTQEDKDKKDKAARQLIYCNQQAVELINKHLRDAGAISDLEKTSFDNLQLKLLLQVKAAKIAIDREKWIINETSYVVSPEELAELYPTLKFIQSEQQIWSGYYKTFKTGGNQSEIQQRFLGIKTEWNKHSQVSNLRAEELVVIADMLAVLKTRMEEEKITQHLSYLEIDRLQKQICRSLLLRWKLYQKEKHDDLLYEYTHVLHVAAFSNKTQVIPRQVLRHPWQSYRGKFDVWSEVNEASLAVFRNSLTNPLRDNSNPFVLGAKQTVWNFASHYILQYGAEEDKNEIHRFQRNEFEQKIEKLTRGGLETEVVKLMDNSSIAVPRILAQNKLLPRARRVDYFERFSSDNAVLEFFKRSETNLEKMAEKVGQIDQCVELTKIKLIEEKRENAQELLCANIAKNLTNLLTVYQDFSRKPDPFDAELHRVQQEIPSFFNIFRRKKRLLLKQYLYQLKVWKLKVQDKSREVLGRVPDLIGSGLQNGGLLLSDFTEIHTMMYRYAETDVQAKFIENSNLLVGLINSLEACQIKRNEKSNIFDINVKKLMIICRRYQEYAKYLKLSNEQRSVMNIVVGLFAINLSPHQKAELAAIPTFLTNTPGSIPIYSMDNLPFSISKFRKLVKKFLPETMMSPEQDGLVNKIFGYLFNVFDPVLNRHNKKFIQSLFTYNFANLEQLNVREEEAISQIATFCQKLFGCEISAENTVQKMVNPVFQLQMGKETILGYQPTLEEFRLHYIVFLRRLSDEGVQKARVHLNLVKAAAASYVLHRYSYNGSETNYADLILDLYPKEIASDVRDIYAQKRLQWWLEHSKGEITAVDHRLFSEADINPVICNYLDNEDFKAGEKFNRLKKIIDTFASVKTKELAVASRVETKVTPSPQTKSYFTQPANILNRSKSEVSQSYASPKRLNLSA